MAELAKLIAAPRRVGRHTFDTVVARATFPRNITSMSNAETSSHRDVPERRHNPRLRELVDEMLASIRAAANVELWTPEERDRCETDMARIMQTVRTHAVDADKRAGLE
jgi:hypothetical protein